MKKITWIIGCFLFLLLNTECKTADKKLEKTIKELSGKAISFDWPKSYFKDCKEIDEKDYKPTTLKIVKYIMRVDEPAFKEQFNNKAVSKFTLNKAGGSTADNEIDSVSGASTTSGAVVNAVNAALDFYHSVVKGAM